MTEKPKIVAYACTYCSYPGADLAGTSRIKYSPHINIVRVLCSGRISPELILRTFREGADGVLVLGCHYGDCHFISGNHRTEGERFAQVVNEFTETIRQLEPMELVLA
jgi:F420-non-reducing hydrogenase iron-sulfur subunit